MGHAGPMPSTAVAEPTATTGDGSRECWRLGHSDRERQRQSLAVRASRPTAWPAHATAHFVNPNLDAALSGGFLFGGGNPTDPLVTRQRGYVEPKALGCRIQLDRLSEILRQLVNGAIPEFLRGHI